MSTAAFTPDGRNLISGAGNHDLASRNQTVELGVAQQPRRATTGHTGSVEAIAFSPDGAQLATGGYDQMIRLWDVRHGYRSMGTLPGHNGAIRLLAYSLDGSTLISAGNDHTIKFWDSASGKERSRLEGFDTIALAPQIDSFAARESSTGVVSIRDLSTGEQRRALQVNDVWTMCGTFSPDGQMFAAGGFNWAVSVFQLAAANLRMVFAGHQDYVIAVAFSPNGRTIASASQDRTVKIWDIVTGQEIRTLVGHTGPVTSVAFAPDGKRLVSGSYDKTIRVWNLEALN